MSDHIANEPILEPLPLAEIAAVIIVHPAAYSRIWPTHPLPPPIVLKRWLAPVGLFTELPLRLGWLRRHSFWLLEFLVVDAHVARFVKDGRPGFSRLAHLARVGCGGNGH